MNELQKLNRWGETVLTMLINEGEAESQSDTGNLPADACAQRAVSREKLKKLFLQPNNRLNVHEAFY